ncbi:MAG: hypothetical protein BroJett011_37970 [Chloroflexota bacterium]|nr:MAG: hypothetical protein BroJett011_37970 [Chloroflexota bacterium]
MDFKVIKDFYNNRLQVKLNGIFGPLPKPDKWVFVVGCYNSGTTLLHNLLASCPEVGSMPNEGHVYTDQLLIPKSVGLYRLWAIKPELFYLDENSQSHIKVNKLKRQWGARYNNPNRPILLEKSPPNTARMRWLQQHFENAHFIGIVRNGYAVAAGIKQKAGCSIEAAARQWAHSNEIMLHDFNFLQHKLLVRYETLTESAEEVFQQMLDFIGLKGHGTRITDQVWSIHGRSHPIENMNPRSIATLSRPDCEIIQSVAGDMLNQLGYSC